MSENVQFDGENYAPAESYYSDAPKGLTGWLVRKGLAKDAASANKILIGIALIALVCAGYFFITSLGGPQGLPEPSPLEAV